MVPQQQTPFTMLYHALLACAETYAPLMSYFKPKNIIRLVKGNEYKVSPVSADFPELVLYPAGVTLEARTTSSITIAKTFLWAMSQDVAEATVSQDIGFYLTAAMAVNDCHLCALQWCGCNFFRSLRLEDGQEGRGALDEALRAQTQWMFLLRCTAVCNFDITLLRQQGVLT